MSGPTRAAFAAAVRTPAAAFTDPDLAAADPVLGADGLPLPHAGDRAVVFHLCAGGDDRGWAVKCYPTADLALADRYARLTAETRRGRLPFVVPARLLAGGVWVGGQSHPAAALDWVEGVPLNRAVRDRADDPAALNALFRAWVRVGAGLDAAGAAHGELSHANVLVVPGADPFRLVDYDSFHFPGLPPVADAGHPNYRHPTAAAPAERDRFPLLVVATALRAVAVLGRRVWDAHDTGDNLLFTAADFRDPAASPLLGELTASRDATLRTLATELARACPLPAALTPWVEDLCPDPTPAEPVAEPRRKAVRPAPPPRPMWRQLAVPLALLAGLFLIAIGGAAGLVSAVAFPPKETAAAKAEPPPAAPARPAPKPEPKAEAPPAKSPAPPAKATPPPPAAPPRVFPDDDPLAVVPPAFPGFEALPALPAFPQPGGFPAPGVMPRGFPPMPGVGRPPNGFPGLMPPGVGPGGFPEPPFFPQPRAALPAFPALAARWTAAAPVGVQANGMPQPPHYAPDGKMLVLSGGADGTVLTFDAGTGLAEARFEGHRGPGGTHWLAPFADKVVSGGFDAVLATWDRRTGKKADDVVFPELPPLPAGAAGHGGITRAVSPTGRYTAVGRREMPGRGFGPLRVLDTTTGKVVLSAAWDCAAPAGALVFTADEGKLFVAGGVGKATWYKLPTGEVEAAWVDGRLAAAHGGRVLGMAADGKRMLYDGPVVGFVGGPVVVDGATGLPTHRIPGMPHHPNVGATLSPDGRYAAVVGRDPALNWYTDVLLVDGWRPVGRVTPPPGSEHEPAYFQFSPDSKELAVSFRGAKKLAVYPLPARAPNVLPVPGVPRPEPVDAAAPRESDAT